MPGLDAPGTSALSLRLRCLSPGAHSKAAQIHLADTVDTNAIDIKAEYEAKNGALNTGAPKVFFRYYFVNAVTGEKSGVMLVQTKYEVVAGGGD